MKPNFTHFRGKTYEDLCFTLVAVFPGCDVVRRYTTLGVVAKHGDYIDDHDAELTWIVTLEEPFLRLYTDLPPDVRRQVIDFAKTYKTLTS